MRDVAGDDVAGRLHTARSRNGIDMTMYRMRQREFIAPLAARVLDLRLALIELADRHRESVFGAHSHTQPAQPSTIAHYLLAVIEQLQRDMNRLLAAYDVTKRLLIPKEDLNRVWVLRKVLTPLSPTEAMELLLSKMGKTKDNSEFLGARAARKS